MSDTKETESYTTVELTLDNDEIIECAILTVYEAAGKEYIALLPLDENLEPNEAGDVYLYQYNETEDGEPVSATSKMMMNTKLPLMLLMNGWIPRNLMNQTSKSNSDTKREGVISFPFFSFT